MSLLLAAGSGWLAYARLSFVTDRNALVDPEAEFNKRFLRFNQAFGDQELMLVVITSAPGPLDNPGFDPPVPDVAARQDMKLAAQEIATRLRTRPDLFPRVAERVDPDSFGGTRMLYLPQPDLEAVTAQIEGGRYMLKSVAQDPSFPGLLRGLRENIEQGTAQDVDPALLKQGGARLASLLKSIREPLAGDGAGTDRPGMFEFQSSDPTLDPDGYFFSWGGRMLFLTVLPAKDSSALDQIKEPLAFAREAVAQVGLRHPRLSMGLTGRPAIYSDEMSSSDRDMLRATILSLIAVTLLFAAWFRGLIKPLYAMFTLGIALVWTVGATTLVIGHLNIFSMVFMPVLVGLGIDYGIQKLNNYQMGMRRGLSVRDALTDTYSEIGIGTITCAITAAAALGTAALTGFLGLAELGIISAMGIMLCLVAMMIVLPAILALHDRRYLETGNAALAQVILEKKVEELSRPLPPEISRTTRWFAVLATLLTVAGAAILVIQLSRGWKIFDYNLLEINDPTSQAIGWERLLINHDQRASFAVSLRRTPQEIAQLREKFQSLRAEGLVRDMESMVPANELEKRKLLSRVAAVMPEKIEVALLEATSARSLQKATREVQAALRTLAGRGEAFAAAFSGAADEAGLLVALCREKPALVEANLPKVERPFFEKMSKALVSLKRDASPPEITASSLPEMLSNRYAGKLPGGDRLYALYLYPAENVWEHERAVEFNKRLLEIDPEATGVTIQIQYSADIIVDGFVKSVIYAALAILLLLFLDFRKPVATFIALIPLIGGLAILGGVMALTGLTFNFANFFAVSILIGTAIDAGVYLVHSQRADDPVRVLRQTRGACVVCSLTTILGFGALMIASHKGVASLGLLLSIGMGAAVFVAFFVVPVVLAWFNARGARV